jgi:hypothetical protein
VDEDLLGGFGLMGFVGSFDELAVDEHGAGTHERNQVGRVDRPPAVLGASMSLNAIANPAALVPGPRVIFVRCRTVAKVDSIGSVVRRWIQCSAG